MTTSVLSAFRDGAFRPATQAQSCACGQDGLAHAPSVGMGYRGRNPVPASSAAEWPVSSPNVGKEERRPAAPLTSIPLTRRSEHDAPAPSAAHVVRVGTPASRVPSRHQGSPFPTHLRFLEARSYPQGTELYLPDNRVLTGSFARLYGGGSCVAEATSDYAQRYYLRCAASGGSCQLTFLMRTSRVRYHRGAGPQRAHDRIDVTFWCASSNGVSRSIDGDGYDFVGVADIRQMGSAWIDEPIQLR